MKSFTTLVLLLPLLMSPSSSADAEGWTFEQVYEFPYFDRKVSIGEVVIEHLGLPSSRAQLKEMLQLNFKNAKLRQRVGDPHNEEFKSVLSDKELDLIWAVLSDEYEAPSSGGIGSLFGGGKKETRKNVAKDFLAKFPEWPEELATTLSKAWKEDEKWKAYALAAFVNYQALAQILPQTDRAVVAEIGSKWSDLAPMIWDYSNPPENLSALIDATYEATTTKVKVIGNQWKGHADLNRELEVISFTWIEIYPSDYELSRVRDLDLLSPSDRPVKVAGFVGVKKSDETCLLPVRGKIFGSDFYVHTEPASRLKDFSKAESADVISSLADDIKRLGFKSETTSFRLSEDQNLSIRYNAGENIECVNASIDSPKVDLYLGHFRQYAVLMPMLEIEGVGGIGFALLSSQVKRGQEEVCSAAEETFYPTYLHTSSPELSIGSNLNIVVMSSETRWNPVNLSILSLQGENSYLVLQDLEGGEGVKLSPFRLHKADQASNSFRGLEEFIQDMQASN